MPRHPPTRKPRLPTKRRIPDLAAAHPLDTSQLLKRLPHRLPALFVLLIVATSIVWQFQFRETGRIYWRDRPLQEWGNPQFSPSAQAPEWHDDGFLSYPSGEGRRTASSRSWLADGGELVKVRLRHRSKGGLKDRGPGKGPPVLVQVTGYTENHQPLIKSPIMVAASDPGDSWKITELVGRLPKEAVTLKLIVISHSGGGAYQLSAIDAVQVERPRWVVIAFMILVLAWVIWIFLALRSVSKESHRPRLTTLLATFWIFTWSALLVFPRPTDHPRPLLTTFNTSETIPSIQAQEWITKSEKAATEAVRNSQIPAPQKEGAAQEIQQWFKSFSGGRFLLHFAVMGLFTGVLLLLMPFRHAFPAILAVTLGAEIVPWILMGMADQKDLWDLLAYALAISSAHFITLRLARLTPWKK